MATRPIAVYTDTDDTDVSLGVNELEQAGFDVRLLDTRDADEIIAGSQDAQALLVGYAEIPRKVIEALPNLKVVALMSMGFNNVDLDAATEHGVWVTNVPGAATEEVATHALTATLFHLRQMRFYLASAQPETWNDRAPKSPPRLSELTLGIVGLGKIGRKLAEISKPIFGAIYGYDPFLPDTAETRAMLKEIGVTRVDLNEVRDRANVLSLNLPLTEETDKMVNTEFISHMPEGAVLLNMSRGHLIDPIAVRDALESGQLDGAVLDVLEEEPPRADHPLLGRDDVVLTPHIAYFSARTEEDYVRIQASNVIEAHETGKPSAPVNQLT